MRSGEADVPASTLDPQGALDAPLRDVDDESAQDAHRRFRTGVDTDRVTDPPLSSGFVDVTVDAQGRPEGLDGPANAGRADRSAPKVPCADGWPEIRRQQRGGVESRVVRRDVRH